MKKVKLADEKTDRRRGVDHIGVSAVSIIHDGEGNILLMKRGHKARDEQGHWDVCGGAIELGEPIIDAIHREVMEELCTVPLNVEFLTAYDAHRKHANAKTHWVALVHAVKVNPKTVKIGESHKIEEIGWFNNDNLPSPLHSQFPKSYKVARKAGLIR